MLRRVAVRAVIIKDGKLLAMRAKPYHPHVRTDISWTVGGTLEETESLVAALEREVIEETGIPPVIGNLLYVHQFKDAHKEHLEFFFHITNADDFLHIDLTKTTHGQEEIAEIDFIDPKTSDVYPEFLRTESFENLAAQPTKFFSYL